MKPIVVSLLAVVSLGAATLAGSTAAANEPEALLEAWQTAIAEQDYQSYVQCLHSGARDVPEYGSPEAFAFWSREIGRLQERGFAGRFEIEPAPGDAARYPPGALLARPLLGGEPMDDAIVLVREAGRWTILRLFS